MGYVYSVPQTTFAIIFLLSLAVGLWWAVSSYLNERPISKEQVANYVADSALEGDATSQFRLGLAYFDGEGVPQDYKEAINWFRKAAEQGYASGQNAIGAMYAQGQGVPQDYKEAMMWFKKAAEQGHPGGQNNLGMMYRDGNGVPQNSVCAHMWFNLAASTPSDAQRTAVENRNIIAGQMTPAQIEEAQELARQYQAPNRIY